MSVKVRTLSPFGGGGGTPAVTSFTDNFNGADTIQDLGPNWISHMGVPAAGAVYSFCRRFGGQMLASTNAPAGSRAPGTWWIPQATVSGLWGIRQFGEMQVVAVASAASAVGPAVMATPNLMGNTSTGYFIEVISAISFNMRSMASGAFTLLAGPLVCALSDTLRLTVIPSAASNLLTIQRNGVTVSTVTDLLASRPVLTGAPGFFTFVDVGESQTWDNFACGLG